MILYNIQHFGNADWLPWLLRMLQHPDNSFLITYDGPQAQVRQLAARLARTPLQARALRVEQSLPVRWCGPSQTAMQIEALRRAVQLPDWEFFVNLSGTCTPLKPQHEIAAHLRRRYRDDGIAAHLFAFPVRKPPVLPQEDPEAGVEQVQLKRLVLRGNGGLLRQFADPAYTPMNNVPNRLFLHCREPQDDDRVLEIARPDPDELAFRFDYLKRHQHFCGRAWYILHRSACEALVAFFDSPDFADSARLFLTCFEPDESFLQTLLLNRLVLPREQVSRDSLRAFQGAPRQLSDDTLAMLAAQETAFFARKVNHAKAAALRADVERRTGGAGGAG